MEKDKVKNFNISSKTGKRSPCLSEEGNLCCNQLITTTTFMSQQAKQTFDIFFNLNCKSECDVYPMGCILWKIQYIKKAETSLNLKLNNHREDT